QTLRGPLRFLRQEPAELLPSEASLRHAHRECLNRLDAVIGFVVMMRLLPPTYILLPRQRACRASTGPRALGAEREPLQRELRAAHRDLRGLLFGPLGGGGEGERLLPLEALRCRGVDLDR